MLCSKNSVLLKGYFEVFLCIRKSEGQGPETFLEQYDHLCTTLTLLTPTFLGFCIPEGVESTTLNYLGSRSAMIMKIGTDVLHHEPNFLEEKKKFPPGGKLGEKYCLQNMISESNRLRY